MDKSEIAAEMMEERRQEAQKRFKIEVKGAVAEVMAASTRLKYAKEQLAQLEYKEPDETGNPFAD